MPNAWYYFKCLEWIQKLPVNFFLNRNPYWGISKRDYGYWLCKWTFLLKECQVKCKHQFPHAKGCQLLDQKLSAANLQTDVGGNPLDFHRALCDLGPLDTHQKDIPVVDSCPNAFHTSTSFLHVIFLQGFLFIFKNWRLTELFMV